jgi:hypothetical protein
MANFPSLNDSAVVDGIWLLTLEHLSPASDILTQTQMRFMESSPATQPWPHPDDIEPKSQLSQLHPQLLTHLLATEVLSCGDACASRPPLSSNPP